MHSGELRADTLCPPVEDSLRRLNTDYIDLYQIHVPDPATPIEETMRALDDLVTAGKVRYIGHSNFTGWQTAEAHYVAQRTGLTPLSRAQNQYSLLDRRIEGELVPAVQKYGVSMLPFFPLASGFLTGKYRQGEEMPEGTRLAGAGPMANRLLTERNFETLRKLEGFAAGARPFDAGRGDGLAGEQAVRRQRDCGCDAARAGGAERGRRRLEDDRRKRWLRWMRSRSGRETRDETRRTSRGVAEIVRPMDRLRRSAVPEGICPALSAR